LDSIGACTHALAKDIAITPRKQHPADEEQHHVDARREAPVSEAVGDRVEDVEQPEEQREERELRFRSRIGCAERPAAHEVQRQVAARPQQRVCEARDARRGEERRAQPVERPRPTGQQRQCVERVLAPVADAADLGDHALVEIVALRLERPSRLVVLAHVDKRRRTRRLLQAKIGNVIRAERTIAVIVDRHGHGVVSRTRLDTTPARLRFSLRKVESR
jgi:hypothetical protein